MSVGFTPLITAFEKLRQEPLNEFKASLGYRVKFCNRQTKLFNMELEYVDTGL